MSDYNALLAEGRRTVGWLSSQGYANPAVTVGDVLDALASLLEENRRLAKLREMFREVHGRVYFDGHEFSEQHGLVRLNDKGSRTVFDDLQAALASPPVQVREEGSHAG